MSITTFEMPLRHADRLYIGGRWVTPSTTATISVVDSATELPFYEVAAASAADMDRAIGAAREAFDNGPWPELTHGERAEYLRGFANHLRQRAADIGQVWPRESGVLHSLAKPFTDFGAKEWDDNADLAGTFAFEEQIAPSAGGVFGLRRREPVGVVGAIIPWNGPLGSISHKVGPALLAGCTVVLKSAPEAPGIGLIVAEIAEAIGLPAGVLNVVTADRETSELLVRDPRVDKISFTGSTLAGRRIASICGGRIARVSLELGGKSAAILLDDVNVEDAAKSLAAAECIVSGQVCYSLTRIVVPRALEKDFAEALAVAFSGVSVGDPYDPSTQIGPLASAVQRDRVKGYIARGVDQGAKLVSGGGRPAHLDRGFYLEPTVFSGVSNKHDIAREEIFGPVLSVIPVDSEHEAVRVANDSIYGLNASVFTPDADRAHAIARRLRSGTVGHNATRSDLRLGFGGFKQSGLGREGGVEGLRNYLETKAIILEDVPVDYR
ncbi:aldehyde dehydrogenase [Rhodococcus sp. 06-156-3C]|uniref:aldehyde dehydrogenase n=1 Tax=Nocardiaceae TaxID=85025 RepID=UPI000522FA39|nr:MULTISPECIES: aldehyde dehydrogenase [Rhodococcus]OZD13099.1 aldehyde dehydrogenase [Rhodococcus sp. 06-156-4a]OZD17968.1 aldehyde dehydrogenase [Rhodococcus sp. 06-156-3C]OZD20692.1 aldehyde dehydrogenase [Rhodococcus sp. 06-156-4C]OZD30589.1 aldehyde dehydrogenase [Rhodococcus sp. 06-156-3b]OZD32638.1 aldehyde dehydrogenase [Rhodococcus sp. 06-156-3]